MKYFSDRIVAAGDSLGGMLLSEMDRFCSSSTRTCSASIRCLPQVANECINALCATR